MEFFLVLIFMAGILGFGMLRGRQSDVAWSDAAGKMDLLFEPGGFFGNRSIRGLYRGRTVCVKTFRKRSGKNSSTHTRYSVSYPSLGLGLSLTGEGIFSGVARFFGGQDIEVGDASFDEGVIVRARDERAAKEYLTPLRRERIERFLANHGNGEITDSEVRFTVRGAETESRLIESRLETLCRLASILSDPAIESHYVQAVEARRDGRLDDALAHAQQSVEEENDVEARLVAAEVLHATRRFEEASAALAEVAEILPEDVEVAALAEEARADPSDLDPETPAGAPAEVPIEPDTRPVEPPPPPVVAVAVEPGTGPDVAEICAALFERGGMSSEANRLFDEQFAGTQVTWTGVLRRLDHYHSDIVFGKGPGIRAVFEVADVATDAYGSRLVQAIVQLPEDARDALAQAKGEGHRFRGRLQRCDAFMRNLFLANGSVDAGS